MAVKNKTNKIEITRVYDAPVKLVWDAWTDTKQVAKWWGPRGFTITTHSKDLRVGGHWAYTMHGPDGTNYENKTIYHEVEPLARLVYDHGGNDDRPPLFRVTVTFKEIKGKTHMNMSMELESVEAAEQTKKFIKLANGNSTWDRLAEYLENESSGQEKFVINRSFNAPIELMFEMWTQPEHFSKWLPPTGFTMNFLKDKIQVGSSTMYSMTNGSDVTMYGRAHYLEIQKPNRIVYTQEFCDENGNLSRHPHAPTWPATMLTVVELSAEGPEQTRVTLTWTCHGHTTTEELQTFISSKADMMMGWTGSFDKLEALLPQNNNELIITDEVIGSGVAAVKGALLICHYTGYLEDGTVFDSSHKHGRPFQFVIGSGRVIQGWDQGLMGMREGGKRKLFVPAHLGYGEREKGLIKPHSNLIFEVEMLEVRPRDP